MQIGVSQTTIGKWEQGRSIKHKSLIKLATCLHINLSELLKDKSILEIKEASQLVKKNLSPTTIDTVLQKLDLLIEVFERKL